MQDESRSSSELTTGGSPPSRHSNPFATCWTRPGAIPFQFSDGESTTSLIARFESQRWRGAIVGPHGSGKSTLLESLKLELFAGGRHIHFVQVHNGQRRLPVEFWSV